MGDEFDCIRLLGPPGAALQYLGSTGKTMTEVVPQGPAGTFWGPMTEWCLQVCSVLLSQRSYTLGPPEKMKAMKSGLQLLPVFSPFLTTPLKSQVLSATCFYSHQPFPQARWRGDRKQIADLEDTFMVVRKMGQGLFLQLCEQVVWLRSHLCIFCSLQQKTVWQLLPYCLLWTVPSASCNLNCVWRLSWKVPLGVLTIKHSHDKTPFSCLLIEISPNS